jgi:hypothetical protein
MRASHLLISFTAAAALPLVVAPTAANAATNAAFHAAVSPTHCHVWFPLSWTRIQGGDGLGDSGMRVGRERRWAVGMSRRHDLFVVAVNSGRTSRDHVWTNATLDCLTRQPASSRNALRSNLRQELERRGAKTVQVTDTTISGRPAELASWTGPTHMGIRIKSLGAYPSTFDFTTDRTSYLKQAKRIIRTLRF